MILLKMNPIWNLVIPILFIVAFEILLVIKVVRNDRKFIKNTDGTWPDSKPTKVSNEVERLLCRDDDN